MIQTREPLQTRESGASPTPRDAASDSALEISLPIYMREMGETRLLERDEEADLARRVRDARRALRQLAERVPARSHELVFADDPHPPADGADWEVEHIGRFVQRLELHENRVPRTLLRDVRKEKTRLEAAREALTVANLRLVVHIAKRYTRSGLPFLDLIQEGNLGLMRAVDKFDIGLGNRFSTYAYWWIKQSIERAVADKARTIRIPVHLGEKRKKLARAAQTLTDRLARRPKPAEIAEFLHMPVDQVEDLLGAVPELRSLDEQRDGGRNADPYQVKDSSKLGSAHERLELKETHHMIEDALRKRLSARERDIVRLRFGLGEEETHTLEQIGRRVGLSRERVRQLEQQAIKKLRRSDALAALLASLGSA